VTRWQLAAYAAQALAAVAAVVLARRHAPHRPAAVALVLLAAVNILDAPVVAALRPLPRPIEGGARVLVYLDGAINLAGYAILAGLPVVLAVDPKRRRRAFVGVAGVWLAASVVLAALYPSPYVRGPGLQQVYVAADFVALAFAALALIHEARTDIAARRSPSTASMLATALVLLDGGILVAPFSPWRGDVFVEPYFGPQLVLAAMFFLIAATEVIAWKLITSSRG
jgi:hypothetical protein